MKLIFHDIGILIHYRILNSIYYNQFMDFKLHLYTTPCINIKNGYSCNYFNDVIEECVSFLIEHLLN